MVNKIEHLVVDTTAFINNAPLHEIADNIVTVQEVVDEITNKRQLRRLVVLPYDLIIKDVFPENVKAIIDFSKKTGDYPSLSATDIKVMALTYQLEKEKVGTEHLREAPIVAPQLVLSTAKPTDDALTKISGFYLPGQKHNETNKDVENNQDNSTTNEITTESNTIDSELTKKFETLQCEQLDDIIDGQNVDDILAAIPNEDTDENEDDYSDLEDDDESGYSDDEIGWITPGNVQKAKKQMDDELVEDKPAVVACVTTDFAMQNVMKQIGLSVSALDGRMIKQLRTYILRCHTCFKTTSKMEKVFCPKCGNNTLKKVAVSVDADGRQKIHINARKPLTARGKKFSLPTFKGGRHSNNPIIREDQHMPQQRPTRQARMKTNALDPDYTAGFSPFVMRDVNSRSALLGIRPGMEVKHWMRKNPNEARRRKK